VNGNDGVCYVIVEGEVDVAVNKSYLCVKGDGDCLGLATVEDGIRLATATARTTVSALELSSDNHKAYMTANASLKPIVAPLLGDVVERLNKIDMFNGVPPKKMTLLAVLLRAVALRDGDVLFEEGSLGQSLFIISEGNVVARARAEDGTVKRLHEFKDNDMFGEIALIMDIPRTADIVALSDTMLFELHRDSFQRFLKLVPGNLQLQSVMKERTAEHFRKYKVPFFEAIPDNKYPILASLCKVEQVPKNTIIFKAGSLSFLTSYSQCVLQMKL
jgi:CRP/FNR family cyclic AMP-dependent transcriptional regulator